MQFNDKSDILEYVNDEFHRFLIRNYFDKDTTYLRCYAYKEDCKASITFRWDSDKNSYIVKTLKNAHVHNLIRNKTVQ